MCNETPITPDEVSHAIEQLVGSRTTLDQLKLTGMCGVYGMFLSQPDLLAPFPAGRDGLIYLGKCNELCAREFEVHFSSLKTGYSSLRQLLGAVLKEKLALKALPRGPGESETVVKNYRFRRDGDERLTGWMREHLRIGVHECERYKEIEPALLEQLQPTLNLTGWTNPHATGIKQLRKLCVEEARVARQPEIHASKSPLASGDSSGGSSGG